MICLACQTDNPEGSRFCMECGTSMSPPNMPSPLSPDEDPVPAAGESERSPADTPPVIDTPPVTDPLSPPSSDPLEPLAGGGGAGAPMSSEPGSPPAPADPPPSGPTTPESTGSGPPIGDHSAAGPAAAAGPVFGSPAQTAHLNPGDPHGLGAVASQLAQDQAGQVRTALVVAAALLGPEERVEAVCQGVLEGVPGVLVLSNQRLIALNQRDWAPTVASFRVDGQLDVSGTEEGGVATVVAAGAGQRLQVDQITDRPPAYDLVARARARTGR